MRRAIVLGAGGFIGHHLVKALKARSYYVVGVDLKTNPFEETSADTFKLLDLRLKENVIALQLTEFDEVYQLAADMGGAGYVFTGDNDADIMQNSATINLHVLDVLKHSKTKVFYASSACIYPEENQMDTEAPHCEEASAFPANPDSEYGWEKLFSERLYLAYSRNYNVDVRIARFHNIYGPLGEFEGGREKAPAAICRKVASCPEGAAIDIWGDGHQTRSFLYIDACIEGILRLMNSNHQQAINIGSTEMVSINELAELIIKISGKAIGINHVSGPQGVRGRCSDNTLIREILHWEPTYPLNLGLKNLYAWVYSQLPNST